MNNIIIAPANLPCALCRRTAGLLMLTVCQHTLKFMEIIRLGLHGEQKDLIWCTDQNIVWPLDRMKTKRSWIFLGFFGCEQYFFPKMRCQITPLSPLPLLLIAGAL